MFRSYNIQGELHLYFYTFEIGSIRKCKFKINFHIHILKLELIVTEHVVVGIAKVHINNFWL
jgi:hypothetical protein